MASIVTSPRGTTAATSANIAAAVTTSPGGRGTTGAAAPSSAAGTPAPGTPNAATTSGMTTRFSVTATSNSTYIPITTSPPQVIPGGSATAGDSTAPTGNKTFPIAAIIVISIVGGLIAIFAAYKIYVCSYRRSSKRDNETSNPYPEARPLASQANLVGGAGSNTAGSRMSMAFGNGTGEGGFGSVWHAGKRTSSMGFGANEMWSQGGNSNEKSGSYGAHEKDAVYDEMNHSRSPTPISPGHTVSRESSPYGRRESQSELGMMGAGERRSSMATMPSRNSMVGNTRRSMYGPTALSNGPQIRSMKSSNRLSGAPHAPHSRIDIVPPLPLGPPPGNIVATDKATLQFSALSGIGGEGLSSDDWFVNSAGKRESYQNASSRNPNFDGDYPPRPRDRSSRSNSDSPPHSFPPPSSQTRSRDSRVPAAFSYNNQNQLSPSTFYSDSASSNSPSSSSSRLPLPYNSSISNSSIGGGSDPRNLPFLNTNLNAPSFNSNPSSPLEKLQQRIAQEADQRDVKARQRTDRVRRANEGDDGTSGGPFSGSSSSASGSGSASGSRSAGEVGVDPGAYRSPSMHLEEISEPRRG